MAVYGLASPILNAIWPEAKLMAIYRSSFESPVRKLHIARKYMFYLLYNTEAMGLKQLLFNYINTLFY